MYSTTTRHEPHDAETYVFRAGEAKRQQTVPDLEAALPWNARRPVARTDGDLGGGAELRLHTSTVAPVQPDVVPIRVNSIQGTVAAIEGRSIYCEMNSGGRAVMVALLPELFPAPPEFGQAFTLEMEERNGFQQPVIAFIEPTAAQDGLTEELDRLLTR